MRTLFLTALLALVAAPLAAQGSGYRWSYPATQGSANPLAPPAALYSGAARPEIRVSHVVYHEDRPAESVAVLYIGSGADQTRQVVRAGSQVREIRIHAIRPGGVYVLVRTLGTVHRLFIPRDGLREKPVAGTL